jgi:integrase
MYLYKHNDAWSFRIDAGINPKTGKRKQLSRHGFKKKSDAQKAATKLQQEYFSNTVIENNNITFKEFSKEWLVLYTPSVKISTVRVRKHELGLLYEFLDGIPIQAVTARQYQHLLAALKESGFADNTISGVHTTARMVFKKAQEFKIIRDDPTEFARPARPKNDSIEAAEEIPRYLEKDELALFLRTARDNGLLGDYATFMVLAYTGMRIGELEALTWNDIDMQECTISISKTLYCPTNKSTEYMLLSPKTPKSYRVLDVDPVVIAALKAYKAEQNVDKMQHKREWHNAYDFVITAVKAFGYPKEQKSFQFRINRLQKIAKIPVYITPHVFRHTHTSLLAEAGIPLHEIMDRLGHMDDDTTRKIYLHVTKNRKKEASKKFAQLMRSVK